MLAASYPFLDVLWSMVIFFMFFIWIMILFRVFADLFRRRDIGGGMKAVWFIFVILLPFLGVFIYLIAEGHKMADRDMEQMQAVKAQQDEYIKSVAGQLGLPTRSRRPSSCSTAARSPRPSSTASRPRRSPRRNPRPGGSDCAQTAQSDSGAAMIDRSRHCSRSEQR